MDAHKVILYVDHSVEKITSLFVCYTFHYTLFSSIHSLTRLLFFNRVMNSNVNCFFNF